MWYTSSVKCSELETDGMVLCEKKKKTMFSVHFYVLTGRFLGGLKHLKWTQLDNRSLG